MLTLDDLCSPEYREQLLGMPWARGGTTYTSEVVVHASKLRFGRTTILDYGCGTVDLGAMIKRFYPARSDLVVTGYDPGIPGKDTLPEPADIVICTDVLEHVEPNKIEAVLKHLFYLTKYMALVVIALRPASKRLPDGRNAHLIIDNDVWWHGKLTEAGNWKISMLNNDGSSMKLLLKQR